MKVAKWGVNKFLEALKLDSNRALRLGRMIWMNVLQMFFVFEDLYWKFFRALEAWICKVSLICSLSVFIEAFELDFNEFWDLEGWLECFDFKCSLYLKVEVLDVLGGFGAWFQQSFKTSECFWIPHIKTKKCLYL